MAALLAELPPDRVQEAIAKTIATEIGPRLIAIMNEMKSARDRLFGDLLKRVAKWNVPALIVANVTGISLARTLGAMAALTVPPLVDYFAGRAEIMRGNAITYLLGARALADSR